MHQHNHLLTFKPNYDIYNFLFIPSFQIVICGKSVKGFMDYDRAYKQTNKQLFLLKIFRYVMCKYMEYVLVNIELNYANSPSPPSLFTIVMNPIYHLHPRYILQIHSNNKHPLTIYLSPYESTHLE